MPSRLRARSRGSRGTFSNVRSTSVSPSARTPRVIDEVAVYLLPLGALTDDVSEQARARHSIDGGDRIAVPATDPSGAGGD